MAKTPMTMRGAELLRAELHRLKAVDRPSVITAIAEARAQQGFIEGRISELEAKLGNAQVIDPKLVDADGRCVFGATVDLEEKGKPPTTYQIVGDDEADIKQGRISINSPIARALIGKETGDIVDAQTPGGVKRYEILDVRFE